MRWFRKVFAAGADNNEDLLVAMQAINFYETEYDRVKDETRPIPGATIESHASRIPGMVAERYAQLADLESILDYFEKREKKTRSEGLKRYLEHYNRTLTPQTAKDYVEAEDDVQVIIGIIQNVAAMRNQFAGLNKSIEYLHFQITNLVKLRIAGLEDATI